MAVLVSQLDRRRRPSSAPLLRGARGSQRACRTGHGSPHSETRPWHANFVMRPSRKVLELVLLDRMVNTRGDHAKTVEGRVDARQDGADGDEEGNVLHKRELKGLDEAASIQLEGQASRR